MKEPESVKEKKPKAIALYSGGLDSTLSILLMLRQKVEVIAITFLTHFGCEVSDRSSCSRNPFKAAQEFGFTVKLCHLGEKFIEIVKNPKYGRGRNMNPCIDCRILMLREAKKFMDMIGADFIITGEVLGQRPMSQRREILSLIDREAGLEGYVLRPLTALNLKPTFPEENGLVARELLFGFKGRSRKPQMALAKELGLKDYPSPAGGCLLTDPIYSYRLRDLLLHSPDPTIREINLLRVGRHFRISPQLKAIVGRHDKENRVIESYAEHGDVLMRVKGFGSPVTLLTGKMREEDIAIAASICARYSDAKDLPKVKVQIERKSSTREYMDVSPADDFLLDKLRIHPREKK